MPWSGTRRLAFTSNTPGRTQTINFYRIDGRHFTSSICRDMDMPRSPRRSASEWKKLIESYLVDTGNSQAFAVVILDARRGWMEQDLELEAVARVATSGDTW